MNNNLIPPYSIIPNFDIKEEQRKIANSTDFLEGLSYVGRFGDLAVATLREFNASYYCELGITEELHDWATELNKRYVTFLVWIGIQQPMTRIRLSLQMGRMIF